MKRRHIWAAVFVCALLSGNPAAAEETEFSMYYKGSDVTITKEELMDGVRGNLEKLDSIHGEMLLDMDMLMDMGGEDPESTLQMNMVMSMQVASDQILDPYASHSTMTMSMNLLGSVSEEIQEIYIREENGQLVSYTGAVYDGAVSEWNRNTGDADDLEMMDFTELLDGSEDIFNDIDGIELLAQKVVDDAGKEYYVLEGNAAISEDGDENEVAGEMTDILDELESSLGAENIQIPDRIPVTIYIGADDMRIYNFFMDLSGIQGTLEEEGSVVTLSFTTLTMQICLDDYNAVEAIEFPASLDGNPEEGTEAAE